MVGCMVPLMLMIFFLPFLFILFYFNIVTISFTKLGLSAGGAFLLVLLSIIGSIINIPVSRRQVTNQGNPYPLSNLVYYYPPRVEEEVIAVNVGGAVIPVLFTLYLWSKVPVVPTLLAVALVTAVAKALARPVPGVGIKLSPFIPPLVAALVALFLVRENVAPAAYIAGVWGTLIGADLLNLHRIRSYGAQVLSIGGAGVFDGIFLVGIVAALLT